MLSPDVYLPLFSQKSILFYFFLIFFDAVLGFPPNFKHKLIRHCFLEKVLKCSVTL